MIARLDARVLAAHQWAVDFTQRAPVWLARQCCLLGLVVLAVRWATVGVSPWAAALLALALCLLAAFTLTPALLRSVTGWRPLRILLLAVLALDALLLMAGAAYGFPARALASFAIASLADLATASFYYFGECRPPRPRAPRPRGRLAHGGAA